MKKKPLIQRVQQLHLWLGTLFAPMIIFFAFTGALQTFSLHEGPRGTPPGLIARLASIHKNQRLLSELPAGPPKASTESEPSRSPKPEGGRESGPSPLPLKIFVALMAIGLIVTTLLGIWMAFKYSRDKRIVWCLLAIGVLLPLALLFV
jgi:hypothetical protein